MDYDKEIDLSGLDCPVPILKTKVALAKMASGEVLKIIVTNPNSVRELHVLAKQTRSLVHEVKSEENRHVLLFEKG